MSPPKKRGGMAKSGEKKRGGMTENASWGMTLAVKVGDGTMI